MRRSLPFSVLLVALAALALCAVPAVASDSGALDAEFGEGGIATLSGIGASPAIAASPNGRLVILTRNSRGFEIRWLRSDGKIDASRGNEGSQWWPLDSGVTCYTACESDVSVSESGTAYALTPSAQGAEIRRFTSGGQVDGAFGSGGVAKLPVNGMSMSIASDGSVTVVGFRSGADPSSNFDYEIVILRTDSGGQLDVSFGGDGSVETGLVGLPIVSAASTNGSILAAGEDRGQAFVWRFGAGGMPDASFGSGGAAAVSSKPYAFNSSGNQWSANSLVALANGGAFFGGDDTFVRCTIKGLWDCTRGYHGWVDTNGQASTTSYSSLGSGDSASVAFGGEQGVYLTSELQDYSGLIQVQRFAADRTPDPGFGVDGEAVPVATSRTAPFYSASSRPKDALTLADGRQVIASEGNSVIKLIRLLGDRPGVAAPNRFVTDFDRAILRSKRKLRVGGIASPSNAQTEIALLNVERKRLVRARGCRWYNVGRREFRRTKSSRGSCPVRRYFRIGRGSHWKFSVPTRLKPGQYELYVRAVSSGRKFKTPLTYGLEGYRAFTVRK